MPFSPRAALGCRLFAIALAGALLPSAALATKVLDFKLQTAPETEGSFVRPNDGFISFYPGNTVLSLELPAGLVSGPVTLSGLTYPPPISSIGVFFQVLPPPSSPSSVVGTFTRIGNEGHIEINTTLRFRRGTSAGTAQQGDLVVTLSTMNQVIPAGCDGSPVPRNTITTPEPIDINALQTTGNSRLKLVGFTCPYEDDGGPIGEYNEAFRWKLEGTVPEPGTGLLVGVGLCGLAAARRRKRI